LARGADFAPTVLDPIGGGEDLFGSASIVEAEENVAKVKEHLKISQIRQKSYVDHKRKDISFEVGDYDHLRVFPLRGMKRLHVDNKLAPRYIGSYMITMRVGKLAYELEVPKQLIGVHSVFHISQLRKCVMPEKESFP
jgi:hypothetical protein